MARKKPNLHTLVLTATIAALGVTPAWAAWTYIGPGTRSVHLTLPPATHGPGRAEPSLPGTPIPVHQMPSLHRLQRQGRLSGVLAHNLRGWQPNHWVAAGHGGLQTAIGRLVPKHTLQVHAGVILPQVSWSAGSASVALYQIARSAGLLLVVTRHAVDVFAG